MKLWIIYIFLSKNHNQYSLLTNLIKSYAGFIIYNNFQFVFIINFPLVDTPNWWNAKLVVGIRCWKQPCHIICILSCKYAASAPYWASFGAEVLHYPAVRYETRRKWWQSALVWILFRLLCKSRRARRGWLCNQFDAPAQLVGWLVASTPEFCQSLLLLFVAALLSLSRQSVRVYYDYNTCGGNFNKLPAACVCRRKKARGDDGKKTKR